MIKYDLTCKCGKAFESWFPSSAEYDALRKKKIIRCIYCDSASIKKSIMAPHLSSKSNNNLRKTKLEKDIKKELLKFRRYIEKNCKYVGDKFSQEARNIHYDKKTSMGIYGSATPEETKELLDEGIEVATIPWVNKSEN